MVEPIIIQRGFEYFKDKIIDEHFSLQIYKDITTDIMNKYWNEFALLPASKTGKHHHPIENVSPFGLVNHSIRVSYLASHFSDEENLTKLRDDFILAALIHDIGKVKYHRKLCIYNHHPQVGAEMVDEFIKILPMYEIIKRMINNHMHQWCGKREMSREDNVLAYADYIATRSEIDIQGLPYLTEDLFTDKQDDRFVKWK